MGAYYTPTYRWRPHHLGGVCDVIKWTNLPSAMFLEAPSSPFSYDVARDDG